MMGVMKRIISILCALCSAGCADPPSAASVCNKLVDAGIAAGCREEKPAGLGAAAVERYTFDLPSVQGKTGQVLRFENKATYTQTVDAFAATAFFAGPHRYGSEKALIFVQMNEGLSLELGKSAKATIEGL